MEILVQGPEVSEGEAVVSGAGATRSVERSGVGAAGDSGVSWESKTPPRRRATAAMAEAPTPNCARESSRTSSSGVGRAHPTTEYEFDLCPSGVVVGVGGQEDGGIAVQRAKARP